MNKLEIRDLLAAWFILGLAFANLLGGLSLEPVAIALFTAGIGFLIHELAHKIVAQRFGLWAEFVADYRMLVFALAASFAGFIFAAPGAVVSRGRRDDRQQMLISVAGPVTNIFLAVIFLFVPGLVGDYGFRINAWLALFNMIPFAGLDGQSVYSYSKPVFFLVTSVAFFLVFIV